MVTARGVTLDGDRETRRSTAKLEVDFQNTIYQTTEAKIIARRQLLLSVHCPTINHSFRFVEADSAQLYIFRVCLLLSAIVCALTISTNHNRRATRHHSFSDGNFLSHVLVLDLVARIAPLFQCLNVVFALFFLTLTFAVDSPPQLTSIATPLPYLIVKATAVSPERASEIF